MRKHSLAKKQLLVLEELFTGQLSEQEILKKYKVSRHIYNKWLNDSDFIDYFHQRIRGFSMQSSLIIARYAPVAAARLVELTASDKEETARKACLDVISMPEKIIPERKGKQEIKEIDISDDAAAKMMKILADDKQSANE